MELCSVAYNPTLAPGMECMPGMLGMQGAPVIDPCCPTPCPPYEEHGMQHEMEHHYANAMREFEPESAPIPVPVPSPFPAPTPAHVKYVVKKGDSVYKIAKRFGTTMRAIILGNNLRNPDLIYPGQIFIIPGV